MTSLSPVQWKEISNIVGCEIAALQAVVEVESAGAGFLPDGRVLLRFENHYWWRLWGRDSHEFLVEQSPKRIAFGIGDTTWSFCAVKGSQHTGHTVRFGAGNGFQKFHGDSILEWQVFDRAYHTDPAAAIQSASFGLPQLMGANFRICGYNTPEAFFADACESEYRQIRMMASFICGQRLDDELRRRDWKAFAFGYNGASYYTNAYDQKLKAAYEKIKAS